MKLFDIFLDSLKITWKNKPMWKFSIFIFTPIFLLTVLIYLIPLLWPLMSNTYSDPFLSFGKSTDAVMPILMISTTILYMLIYLGGVMSIQIGSNIQCWQENTGAVIARKKDLLKAILRKILPSLPGYFLFIVIPYIILFSGMIGITFFLEDMENSLLILLLFLFTFLYVVSLYIGIYLTFIFLPVTLPENISFSGRLKLSWQFIRSNFLNVVLYSLIVGVADFVANMILYIPFMIIYMALYIPIIMMIVAGENYVLPLILFISLMMIISVLLIAARNLIITARQTAFTRYFYLWYKDLAVNEPDAIIVELE